MKTPKFLFTPNERALGSRLIKREQERMSSMWDAHVELGVPLDEALYNERKRTLESLWQKLWEEAA